MYLKTPRMKNIKIQIKSRFNGSILFEYESEGNTIKETLIQGIKVKANLYGANLEGANLYGANLEGAKIPIFSKWSVSIIDNKFIKIGCKQKTIEEWDLWFSSTEEYNTIRGTEDFKRIYAMYLAYRAYLKTMNDN